MTGEEMERAIEFLLRSQAHSETRIARLEAAQIETNRHLDSFADTQAALMQVATETFAAQNRINEDVRRNLDGLRRGWEDLQRAQEAAQRAQEAAWATMHRLGDRQDRAEAIVERLAETVRDHIEGGSGASRG